MKKFGSFLCLVLMVSVWASPATVQTPAPVLFFTDLTQGPNGGGENNSGFAGAYVTLYGNFLTSPTVTWNGLNCLRINSQPSAWLWYQRMVVQLGSGCTAGTGNFVVTTPAGTSNGISFTVASSGHIYFVSTTGNDNSAGTFQSPWATLIHARNTMVDGDITYAENGVFQSTDDGEGWNSSYTLRAQWCGSAQRAVVGYPGAKATIGSIGTSSGGITGVRGAGCKGNITFAELTILGNQDAFDAVGPDPTDGVSPTMFNVRIIGNDISCPWGNSPSGCLFGEWDNGLYEWGNNLHNIGTNRTQSSQTNQYHGVYVSAINLDFGWNLIDTVYGCRGFQLNNNSPSVSSWNLYIHDNTIHDTECDAIGAYGFDPSKGPVRIYNNLIYNAGMAMPADGPGNFACLHISAGWHGEGVGNVEFYNNTLYNCGGVNFGGASGGIMLDNNSGSQVGIHLQNNIIYNIEPNAPYWTTSGSSAANIIYGTKTIMYGIGAPPASSAITGTINSNPGFVSTSTPDFHLAAASSVANGAGSSVSPIPAQEHDGLLRPSPPSIGAYEYAAGTVSVKPNPPTNLTVVVH